MILKILLTSDVHLRDNPPSMCTDEYLPELFLHLSRIGRAVNGGLADAVVFAGDFFDNKIPHRNSHKLVQHTLQILKTYKKPTFILPGNHDETADQFDSVFETQPLGILIRSGAARLLSGWADGPQWKGQSYGDLNAPIEHLPIYGVPWLPEWDHEDSPDREAAVHEALEGLDVDFLDPILVVSHAPFFPPGHESPYESYPTPRFARIAQSYANGPVSVFYGHIHEPHGIYDVDGIKFANAGALSRGSLHEYNINRPIQLTIWDSKTGEFEIFEIPHLPASRIFKMEEVVEKRNMKMELNNFLSEIGSTTLKISSTEDIIDHVQQLAAGNDEWRPIVKVIQELLDEVRK